MTTVGVRIDRTGRLFFISYARPSGRNLGKEKQFYKDLSEDVGELQGREVGQYPGFMDFNMKPGTIWSPELLEAVGHCQVLIPLLSRSLTTSEWCAKEWHAFSLRSIEAQPNAPQLGSRFGSGILPVLWTPMKKTRLPRVIGNIQIFAPADPDLADLYEQHGIYGLTIEDKEAYRRVVWELAQQIDLLLETYHVVPGRPEVDKLLNIFEEPHK